MFAPASCSLALSYNRLVLVSLKRVKIGRNHSGATHSPVLDACRKRVKVGFRGRCSSVDDFEFVAGAALSSVLVEFCGRHGTLELDSARSLSLWRGAHFEKAK